MKIKSLEDPSPKKAGKHVKKGIKNRLMITIFGECEVNYQGRAESYLGLGDRLTILKPDGSLLVHQKEKRKPVNWQPPGSKHITEIRNGQLVVRGIRRNPEESLEVIYDQIYQISNLEMKDSEEINLRGTEEDMKQKILQEPKLIEEGFKPITDEKDMDFGYIDIYGRDKNDVMTIIELKRSKAGPKAVSQLRRYLKKLRNHIDEQEIRGILASPGVTEKAEKYLREENLEHKRLSISPKKDLDSKETTLDQFK